MSGQQEKPTVGAIATTIFWSFFGVRRRTAHESETVKLKPVHLIVAGIVGAAVFVVVLVSLAMFIVSSTAG